MSENGIKCNILAIFSFGTNIENGKNANMDAKIEIFLRMELSF